jgi:hypothetical protein
MTQKHPYKSAEQPTRCNPGICWPEFADVFQAAAGLGLNLQMYKQSGMFLYTSHPPAQDTAHLSNKCYSMSMTARMRRHAYLLQDCRKLLLRLLFLLHM